MSYAYKNYYCGSKKKIIFGSKCLIRKLSPTIKIWLFKNKKVYDRYNKKWVHSYFTKLIYSCTYYCFYTNSIA